MGMNSKEKKSSSVFESTNRLSNSKKANNTGRKSDNKKEMNSKKKIWSFDALVEAMKPSSEELEYRRKKSKEFHNLEENSKLFQCTICHQSFETIIKKHEKIPTHPCLGVLMCQMCCDYYEDGEFSLDSEGEDKYCRWCGEGGTIFGCSKCICGFCAKCIKFHFNQKFFRRVQKDDNWLCFFCDPKPLWGHRFICSLAEEMSNSQDILSTSSNSNKSEKEESKLDSSFNDFNQSSSSKNLVPEPIIGKENSRKRSHSSSSDDLEHEILEIQIENQKKKLKLNSSSSASSTEKMENDPVESLKSDVLKELERVIKLSENQMNFGVIWSTKMLKNLSNLDCKVTFNELVNKCQKIKSSLSVFSAYLVHLSNSADSLEKMLLKNDGKKIPSDCRDKEKSSYANILQFLGFINNQVKTFMEKGINLSDVLEAEIYDDVNVIGIKKKLNSSMNTFNEDKNVNPIGIETNIRNDDYDDSESKEVTGEQKVSDEDRDGSSLEIVVNSSAEDFMESDDECQGHSSSYVTSQEMNYSKNMNEKDDIQEILAILENA